MIIPSTLIRVAVGYFVLSLTRKNFVNYYINIIYVLSIIGFFFFIPSQISPAFFNFFKNNTTAPFEPPFAAKDGFYNIWPTNIIYCFHDCVLEEHRNPAAFWEPGLYSIFVVLALGFNLVKERTLLNRKSIVLIAALLSTVSTGGYAGFFVLLFAYFIVNQPLPKKILYSVLIIPVLLTIYFSVSFLSAKVEQNVSMASSNTTSRFGSGLADLQDFSTSPIIGWGRGVMRYGGRMFTFFSEDQHRNNGITEFMATYGSIAVFTYFYFYYYSLKVFCLNHRFNKQFAWWFLLVILVLGFSQTIFLRPFYYGLLYWGISTDDKQHNTTAHEDFN